MEANKCALVTGGSRGIGAGVAKVLAREGYDVAVTYSSAKQEGEAVVAAIQQMGRRAFLIQANLQEREAPERTVKEAIRLLGRLDLLVNNAGLTIHANLLSITDEKFDMLNNLDFRAYVYCARTAARHMVKHGIRGNIISITSTHSVRAYPTDGMYGGFKAGLNRATESFALDLAPYGIRVNAVAPGATRIRGNDDARLKLFYEKLAPRIPLQRIGTPEDIGEAVAFLADNNKSGYITGVTIKVDGGLVLPGMPEAPDAPSWITGKIDKTWDDSDL